MSYLTSFRAPVQFEYQSEGSSARQRLYDDYSSPQSDGTDHRFVDTLLLHHMNPKLALSLGARNAQYYYSDDDEDSNHSPLPPPEPLRNRYRTTRTPFRFPQGSLSEKVLSRPSQNVSNSIPRRSNKPRNTRLALPITLDAKGIAATVLATADTSADVNIISEELARALGHKEYGPASARRQFTLANGKIIEAIGQITSICAFGMETEMAVSVSCVFHVLLKVVTPIIMGLQFLEHTETMTKHRNRLIRVPRPALQSLSVCSVDRPRKQLSCYVGPKNTPVLATPDTGSEIDLISPKLASELGLAVQPGSQVLELADGSLVRTDGFVDVLLSLAAPAVATVMALEFHLLQELTHTLLIGEETLEELSIFKENQHSLVPTSADIRPLGLNAIQCRGRFVTALSSLKQKLGLKKPEDTSQSMFPSNLPGTVVLNQRLTRYSHSELKVQSSRRCRRSARK
jgi:hypothetical protein